jgi:hypothetical protein
MKKAQTVVIGFAAIMVIMILFVQLFMSEFKNSIKDEDKLKATQDEAFRIGKMLAASSSPYNWTTPGEVVRIGLLQDDFVYNDTLRKIAHLSYPKSKLLLAATKDYIFFLTDLNGTVIKVDNNEYWGWNRTLQQDYNGGSSLTDILSDIKSSALYIGMDDRFIRYKETINSTPEIVHQIVYTWGR